MLWNLHRTPETRIESAGHTSVFLARACVWVFVTPWWGFLPAYLAFSWWLPPLATYSAEGAMLSYWVYGVALTIGLYVLTLTLRLIHDAQQAHAANQSTPN